MDGPSSECADAADAADAAAHAFEGRGRAAARHPSRRAGAFGLRSAARLDFFLGRALFTQFAEQSLFSFAVAAVGGGGASAWALALLWFSIVWRLAPCAGRSLCNRFCFDCCLAWLPHRLACWGINL